MKKNKFQEPANQTNKQKSGNVRTDTHTHTPKKESSMT